MPWPQSTGGNTSDRPRLQNRRGVSAMPGQGQMRGPGRGRTLSEGIEEMTFLIFVSCFCGVCVIGCLILIFLSWKDWIDYTQFKENENDFPR